MLKELFNVYDENSFKNGFVESWFVGEVLLRYKGGLVMKIENLEVSDKLDALLDIIGEGTYLHIVVLLEVAEIGIL